MVLDPWIKLDRLGLKLARDRAISLAQKADEVRPATINLLKANRQQFALLLLILSNPPTQVDRGPGHPARFGKMAQRREHLLHQLVSLAHHVSERRGHEHTNGTPRTGQVSLHENWSLGRSLPYMMTLPWSSQPYG